MRNKLLLTLLSIVCVLCCVFALVACENTDANVESIKLNQKEITLNVGKTANLIATVTSNDSDKTVKWTSSDESVATVSDNGTVTAINYGMAWITASFKNLSVECQVIVQNVNVIPVVHNHVWEWKYDEDYHWQECTVNSCGEGKESVEHTFIDGKCVCGKASTHVLEFKLKSGEDSYEVIDCYDKSITEIIIPDTFNGKSVTSIGAGAFNGCTSLSSVVIPACVHTINEQAFSDCHIENATIPALAINYIKNSDLKTVTITSGNIGYYAFEYCSSLTSVTIFDDVDVSYSAFQGCPIENATIPARAAQSVNNPALKTVVITSGEIIFSGAFDGCSMLTSITIPDSVTEIGEYAFEGTAWYDSQPDGIVYAGKIAYAYKGDKSDITSISIKEGTKCLADSLFSGCGSLVNVTIPDGVLSIGAYAFWECSNLASLSIPNSVTSINLDGVFYGCSSLASITVGVENLNYSSQDGILYNKAQTEMICVPQKISGAVTIPSSMTSIRDYAFDYCSGLRSITIPDGVTSIGDRAFGGCSSLTSITIPDSVISIGESAFSNCSGLTDITLPDSVTSIGGFAFHNCSRLTKVNYNGSIADWCNIDFGASSISDGSVYLYIADELLTELVIPNTVEEIKDYAFDSFASITSVVISNSVMSIGQSAFRYCCNLTSITIPDSVMSIGEYAFNNCSGLTDITLPDRITSIGAFAFSECRGLTSIIVPDNVTSIGEHAFYNCSGLKDVTLGNSVATIGYAAFVGCVGLTSITFPDSITQVDSVAFNGCTSLETVVFPEGFDSSNIQFYNCPKYKGALVGNCYIKGATLTGIKDGVITAIVPSSVTTISANAFKDTNVKYVYVPESVTTIESGAFTNTSIDKLFYEGRAITNLQNATYPNIGSCTNDGWIYDVRGSNVSIRAYIGLGGEVTVPAQIDGKAVSTLSQEGGVGNVFLERDDITKITLTSANLTVEAGTLANLANLVEIALSEGVGGVSMSKAAYEGCANLAVISIAGGYDNYQIMLVTFTSTGQMSGQTTVDVSDGADVLAKLNEASGTTICMIMMKGQN